MQKYEIVIKGDSGTSSSGGGVAVPKEQNNGSDTVANALTSSPEKLKEGYKMYAKAVAVAAPIVQMFKGVSAMVIRNTGNADIAEKVDGAMEVAGKGAAIIGGALVGGVYGAVGAALAIGISYAFEAEQTSYERRWENIAIGETRYRAGASLNRSR